MHRPAAAQPANADSQPAPRPDFSSFHIIAERNIFDANRSAHADGRRNSRKEPERPIQSESFALVGTMAYEKGHFAFFDGSSLAYRKVLQAAESIAGYRIAEITPSYVKLEAEGRRIELPVGAEMRRQDEGEWSVAAQGDSSARSSPPSSSPSSNGETQTPAAVSGAGGPESDVLKRLLQKREQELQNEKK